MKFSIIVPAHNAESTIGRCLDSICTQRGIDDLQVLVVDDYSQDLTYEKCQEICDIYDNIEVLRSAGSGVSAARNMGLRYADGDIIGFCDSDDYYESGMLASVAKEFEENDQLDMCCTGIYNRLEDGTIAKEKVCKRALLTGTKMFERIICDTNIMGSVCNKFYKMKILRGIRFNETLSYCEDMHFNAVVLSNHWDIQCMLIDRALYNYSQVQKSVTNDYSSLFNSTNVLKYIESMHQIEEDCELTKSQKKLVRMLSCKFAVGFYHKPGLELDVEKKEILKSEIKRNLWDLITRFYKYDVKNNIKSIIKGLIILIKGDL